ncbi:MAG: GYD domain-containing protein [Chthoniobacteraceae bacterium]
MTTTYLSLLTLTDEGAREIRQSPKRAMAWREEVETEGVKLLAQLWTAGVYDGALILQGEEVNVLGALARLAARGNVRPHTLRAFDAKDFANIIDR